MAQSTVTLHGLVNGDLNHVSSLRNRSFNGIMDGSLFGLRSTEDTGGGYKISLL